MDGLCKSHRAQIHQKLMALGQGKQSQQEKHSIFLFHEVLRIVKSTEVESVWWVQAEM